MGSCPGVEGGREPMMRAGRCLRRALIPLLLVVSVCLAEEGPPRARRDTAHAAVKRHTLKELRDQYVVKQDTDYSCGAAALATLLTYYFGEENSEQQILELMNAGLTKVEQARKHFKGYSLLDLQRAARLKGYQAAGFKLTVEQLTQLAAPVIVFVQPMGYKHFAVLRGVDRGRVFLADPIRGNLRMSIGRFLAEWDGIIFVLGKAGEEALTTYPLALHRPDYVQPELQPLRGGRMLDPRTFP
jgi:uncharacterized protein